MKKRKNKDYLDLSKSARAGQTVFASVKTSAQKHIGREIAALFGKGIYISLGPTLPEATVILSQDLFDKHIATKP